MSEQFLNSTSAQYMLIYTNIAGKNNVTFSAQYNYHHGDSVT